MLFFFQVVKVSLGKEKVGKTILEIVILIFWPDKSIIGDIFGLVFTVSRFFRKMH